jgi:hypothetical protein
MDNNTFKINDNSSSFQNNSPSLFDWVKSISIYTWILFFIVLSLLGFNIVIYLEKIKQYLKDGLTYISNLLKKNEKSSESPEQEEDPNLIVNEKKISEDNEETGERNVMKDNTLNIALNDNATREKTNNDQSTHADYQADDSRSFLNSRNEGWCFIGENNGARVCGEVGLNDECMSGKIFPSSEICVNPNLRV